MKGTVNKLLCPGTVIFFLLALAGCIKDLKAPGNSPMRLYGVTTDNLVANPDFTDWDIHTNSLKDWNTTTVQTGVPGKDGDGLRLEGNAPGPCYVYQLIHTEGQQFYEASVKVDYTIKNYFSCGLYIMDSSRQTILGKFERTFSDSSGDIWKAIFFCQQSGPVALAMGFLHGVNASAVFHHVSFMKYDYQSIIGSTDLSRHLSEKFPLDFSARQFDSTVCRIADYVNSVLLCKYTYYADTAELPVLDVLIGQNSDYSYFNGYRLLVDSLPVAYCQKSSLSLAEILSNEFNISVRQVHMVFGGIGKHQFTEYWNPFTGKWIAVDPCFNIHYVKNNALLGVEDLDRADAPAYMTSFGGHVFHSFLPEDLPWYWKNMDSLQITDHYSLTFPYAP